MPDNNTFKLDGTKLVPINRFNLEASKPSSSFSAVTVNNLQKFTVIEHPVVHSININPTTPVNRERLPLVENNILITENSLFQDYNDNKIFFTFPEVIITPNDNTVFYYENILDAFGRNSGLYGYVTLRYAIRNKPETSTLRNIPIQLREVVLNLRVENNKETETVKINGLINPEKSEILFNLKDQAVKIAFLNMVTKIETLKSSLDLFFDFKGYTKFRRKFLYAKGIDGTTTPPIINRDPDTAASARMSLKTAALLDSPLLIRSNSAKSLISKETMREIQKEQNIVAEEPEQYVKSTFLLKVNKTINYPLAADASISLYKTIDGGFIVNPFNSNYDFSQFRQIFIPGVNYNKLSIYKSTIQPNTFLLISKIYCLSRAIDTKKPCISTIFHAYEDGTGLTEDISKISFQFALGPDLSDYDLTKLKIDLKNNNFLDGNPADYLNEIQFLYPNNIDSDFDISGNYFLQKSDVTTDGKYFLFSITTENLNDASLLINALNNSVSQFANINFRHKEIKDTSIIELNIEKTNGELLDTVFDRTSKKLTTENKSISKCKINAVLFIDHNNAPYFNNAFFTKYPLLDSGQTVELALNAISSENAMLNLKDVYFDYESIEDISTEFSQIVSKSTDYNKYIQLQIQKQNTKISKIQIELVVDETLSKFNIEKLKAEFSIPVLFNFIIKNTVPQGRTTLSYRINYFDKNDNIIASKNSIFDFSDTSIITIPKHK